MRIKSPCKDCPERREACWGKCEKYKEFRAKLDEAKHNAKLVYEVNEYVYDAIGRVKKDRRMY